MSDPAPLITTPKPSWRRASLTGLAGVGILAYSILLATRISPYASSSDSSGYFNSGRLLSRGEFFAPVRALPSHKSTEFGEMTFQPLGFRIQPKLDKMVPTYPIGLPL